MVKQITSRLIKKCEKATLSLFRFNSFSLCAEYILRETVLEEDECGVKYLHHADDITLMDEIANDLQALVMKIRGMVKKMGRLNIKTTKLMAIYNSNQPLNSQWR